MIDKILNMDLLNIAIVIGITGVFIELALIRNWLVKIYWKGGK